MPCCLNKICSWNHKFSDKENLYSITLNGKSNNDIQSLVYLSRSPKHLNTEYYNNNPPGVSV